MIGFLGSTAAAELAPNAWSTGLCLAQTRVIYQWLRVEQLDQWWHWLTLAVSVVAIAGFVVFWYRRDSVEHPRTVGWALMLLRLAALVGVLLYFFQLDKRTEQRVVRDSRVAVLVDTSLSMSLPGTPSSIGVASNRTRSAEAASLLAQSDFLQRLSAAHQLSIYRFDQLTRPVVIGAIEKQESTNSVAEVSVNDGDLLARGRRLMTSSLVVGAVAALLLCLAWGAQIVGVRNWAIGGWMLFYGSLLSLIAMVLLACAIVPTTRYPLASLLGADLPPLPTSTAATISGVEAQSEETPSIPADWNTALQPTGTETHLGDAIKSVLDRETGSPLAGIVVLTDGRNNAGADPRQVVAAAQNQRVPLYVIGLGSERSPPNLQLVEIDVPKRLYPGDRFSLNALLGSSGFDGQTVTVQILAGPVDVEPNALGIEAETSVVIPSDGGIASAQFELQPKTVGEWQYAAKILPLSGEASAADNIRTTQVEVIERKNRVLILAGGPTREYQFVRNLLYRDRDVESHVLLQTGTERSSQESQQLLTEFPVDRAALAQYDAVLAFDADWTEIAERSVQGLEQWVAEQAGGFLMVAGTVEMPKWIARSASGTRSQNLRSLSPVVLDPTGSSLLAMGRIESARPWPLSITPDGMQTDFLWLSDNAETSAELWQDFDGVYGFYSAYELKPGAKALALFSDPTAAVDGQQPIYMASQFYGAGRVVFIGGGELWRLRRMGDQYFDRMYTKLVRWISQGRLLMDSDRGVLLVDREQATLGDQVVVRAVLKDERYQPLMQSEVVARLLDAQGRNLPLVLRPLADGSQPGVYTGQFPVVLAGEYTIQLQLGGLGSDEILSTKVEAKIPARELQQSERNDALLRPLAVETGGKYWTGVQQALQSSSSVTAESSTSQTQPANRNQDSDIVSLIEPQDQVAYLPGAPDRTFQLRWLGWLMAWVAGCLSLEWLSRRLHRLA